MQGPATRLAEPVQRRGAGLSRARFRAWRAWVAFQRRRCRYHFDDKDRLTGCRRQHPPLDRERRRVMRAHLFGRRR